MDAYVSCRHECFAREALRVGRSPLSVLSPASGIEHSIMSERGLDDVISTWYI